MSLDWQPRVKVIIVALKTVKPLAARKESDLEMVDWYFTKKLLSIIFVNVPPRPSL